MRLHAALVVALSGCSPAATPPVDAGSDLAAPRDASVLLDASVAPPDAAQPECQWGGAPGTCLLASACAAIADHSAEPGSCASGLLCCIDTPDVGDDPPIPAGYKLMMQSQVTPAMTNWAVMILHDPVTYPMFSTTMKTFGALMVLARVEWHPPDFQNGVVHRGVTLYIPK
jgi:hypothetical protein